MWGECMEVLKILAISMFVGLGILLVAAGIVGVVSEYKDTWQEHREIRKKIKNFKEYPSIPLTMVTEHFGWSYELNKQAEWEYRIWCVQKGKKNVIMDYASSRTTAHNMCQKFESLFYGGEGE